MLPIIKSKTELHKRLYKRWEKSIPVTDVVAGILETVRQQGDAGLRKLTEKFDKVVIDDFRVSEQQLEAAQKSLDIKLRQSILLAAENIRRYHMCQYPEDFSVVQPDGTQVTQCWRPQMRVGIYVPGGRYPLLSTVLMNVIPAQVAQVREIIICTPPGESGYPDNSILATCRLLGITDIFRIGGAQAIAAMAYGTESIPPVDKITGPGNAYVTAAKRTVSATVAIDMVAGPTEVVIIADKDAQPEIVAADLIAQAEHDPMAWPVLLTDSNSLALEVNTSIKTLLQNLTTRETAQQSLTGQGLIFVADSLETCKTISNQIAPEHLSLQINKPDQWIGELIAGAIFIGTTTPVTWGDYWAGPNHTLPTSGQARFRGLLSTLDFLVPYSTIRVDANTLKRSSDTVMTLAETEGLAGHALAIEQRLIYECL